MPMGGMDPMSQLITATFNDGVLKPDERLELVAGAKVRLLIMPFSEGSDIALDELDRLCDEHPIDSGGERLTRDQLHERN
jgi:predicted DNA-binding antitoxin AbrB/MazE fold protein